MTKETFYKLGDILDDLYTVINEAGEYKSDILGAYSDLDDVYEAVKADYGYKNKNDEE